MNDIYKKLKDKFPFLVLARYLEEDYIGIIQNSDQQFTSMYILNDIQDDDLKAKFLELGETWWWESNRTLPINIFLKDRFSPFKPYLKTFSNKEFELLHGPAVSLQDLVKRRTRKKQIQVMGDKE